MDNIKKVVGQKIRNIRKEKGLTQEELGNLCGLSYKFISDVERGKQNPSLDSLASIAKGLNVQLSTLFDFQEPQIKQNPSSDFCSSNVTILKELSHYKPKHIKKALKTALVILKELGYK
jgi:transcriptional regulator with XRE-family HTH domain